MRKQREVTFSIHKFHEDTTDLAIRDWQEVGVERIWQAMLEMSELAYALRGVNVVDLPMDKSVFVIQPAPWSKLSGPSDQDA